MHHLNTRDVLAMPPAARLRRTNLQEPTQVVMCSPTRLSLLAAGKSCCTKQGGVAGVVTGCVDTGVECDELHHVAAEWCATMHGVLALNTGTLM